ncbi:MAG TPA: hypothetical protein PLK63_17840, partial [Catalimonadaceae bacterium]|nr:hypothetical protein [Catalimonadaceae bacterium]
IFKSDFVPFLHLNPERMTNSANSYFGALSTFSGSGVAIASYTFVIRYRNCICQSHTTPISFLG